METDWQTPDFVGHYNATYEFTDEDIRRYLEPLQLSASDVLVDFGCGNGSVLKAASPQVSRALGIDGSAPQIALARQTLQGLANVTLQQVEFLACDLDGWTISKAASRKALHHLTDPEKEIFTRHLGEAMSAGGLFLMEDGIFSFERSELELFWPQVLEEAERYYGERWEAVKKDVIGTLRDEFPTGIQTWRRALDAGGFTLLGYKPRTCFYGTFLARKEK